MKKILFGSAAALCAVAGLSSFNQIHRTFAGTHYFHVKSGNGDLTQFRNSQVDVGTQVDPGAVASGCNTGANRCVVVFTDAQITHTSLGSTILKTIGNITQTIASTKYTRSAL